MPVISITRLRVRSWRFMPGFIYHTLLSSLQVRRAAGILSVTLLKDRRRTFWTVTVWTDETAIKSFMLSGDHRRAMPRLLEYCDEAAVARWHQDDTAPPSWEEAHQRLQRDGRSSSVNHPSAAQLTFEIPAPKVGKFREFANIKEKVND